MSRTLEHFLEKKLNEYRRKSKTILIVYKCRYYGMKRSRTQKTKNICRNDHKARDFIDSSSKNDLRYDGISSNDILDEILETWPSSSRTDMSTFFDEYCESSSDFIDMDADRICSSSEHDVQFPYNDPKRIVPLLYWNLETEYMKQTLDEDCDKNCKRRKKPKLDPIHLDAISRLRLQSFIRSLCEDRCNSKLCQPDVEEGRKSSSKLRRKRKDKKGCKLKKDASMVSFHITVPKQTKSVLLKNDDLNPPKSTKCKARRTDDSAKCRNCPFFKKDTNIKAQHQNVGGAIPDPANLTFQVGNQTITISMKNACYNVDEQQESNTPFKNSPQKFEENTEGIKKCFAHADRKKNNPDGYAKEKRCDCLQKLEKSMNRELQNCRLPQLNLNNGPVDKIKVCNCQKNKPKVQQDHDSGDRSGKSCTCKLKTMKNNIESKRSENHEEGDVIELSNKNYPRCIKICLEPEDDDEDEDEPRPKICGCAARNNAQRQRDKEKESPRKSLKCHCKDASMNFTSTKTNDKCCHCCRAPEKKKCHCPKSQKKQPEMVNKSCQCHQDLDKDTQVEMTKDETTEPKEISEGILMDEENNELNDEITEPKRNSVEETYSVSTKLSSRRSSKASSVKESDTLMKDKSCSCCICDNETDEDSESSECGCGSIHEDYEEDEVFPTCSKNHYEQSEREQSCKCEMESQKTIHIKPILRTSRKTDKLKSGKHSCTYELCDDDDFQSIQETSPHRKKEKLSEQKFASTEDVIECECEEFEQLIEELEEYCRTKCVSNSPTSSAEEPVFMVQKDRCRSPTFHIGPTLSKRTKKLLERKGLVFATQNVELNPKMYNSSESKADIKYCYPRITSCKLSDQRLRRREKIRSHCRKSRIEEITGVSLCSIGFEHVGKESHACASEEKIEITPDSSNVSIEDENVVCNTKGMNDNLFGTRRTLRKSTTKNLDNDGILLTKGAARYGRIKEPYSKKYNEYMQNLINLKSSVFILPALLEKIEMQPPTACRRSKETNSRTDDISWDNILSPVLQGRAEIHPRQSRMSQKQFRKKQYDRHAEISRQYQNFDREHSTYEHLLSRVEKSSERIVRSITVRSMKSVKRIGAINKKLIVKVFEKYISEILDCDAKLLLGRKNLALATYEDYLIDTPANKTYFFNIEYPFESRIYPVFVQECPAANRTSITPECGDKQTVAEKKLRCNCKQKDACCHCLQLKAQLTENKKGSCVKGEKANDSNKTLKTILKPTDMKMSSGCACSQPTSVQKNIEQAGANMEPGASSLVSGNDMKVKKRCDCGKKNSMMQTIGEGEAMTKTCNCAKRSKKRRKSRSRSRSKSRGSKSTKQKCDCTEPCETKTPVSAEGDQPQKDSCACESDLKNQDVTVCCTSEPPAQPESRCPCPCRQLMQMKPTKRISAYPNGNKENKKEDICGICGDRSKISEEMSMSTYDSSDFERIAGILQDTRESLLNQKGHDRLLSNIRCFRNSSGIICQSEVTGCSTIDEKTGKCKTNTIEIRIKYPNRKGEKSKEKSCAVACTNTDYTKASGKRVSCCGATATRSDLSMLLDSFARKDPVVCQTTQCVRSNTDVNVVAKRDSRPSGDCRTLSFCQTTDDIGVCALKRDSIPCQESTCAASDTNKKDVKCIFKREKSIDDNDSCYFKQKSSDSLDSWGFLDEPEDIQIGSCSKESCMRLVKRPTAVVKKHESAVECDVKGSCVRQKLFEKLYPDMTQPCRIPSKKGLTSETSTSKKPSSLAVRRNSGNGKGTSSKKNTPSSSKTAVGKSSSKNINANKSKPACSKEKLRPKKKDTMKLDAFDQNILAHALDTFLSSKGNSFMNKKMEDEESCDPCEMTSTSDMTLCPDDETEEEHSKSSSSEESSCSEIPVEKNPYNKSFQVYYLNCANRCFLNCGKCSGCRPTRGQCAGPTCYPRCCPCYNKHFRCCLPAIINKPRPNCIIPVKKCPPQFYAPAIPPPLKKKPKPIVEKFETVKATVVSAPPRVEAETEVEPYLCSGAPELQSILTQTSSLRSKHKRSVMIETPIPIKPPCLRVLLRGAFNAICSTTDEEQKSLVGCNFKHLCKCTTSYIEREMTVGGFIEGGGEGYTSVGMESMAAKDIIYGTAEEIECPCPYPGCKGSCGYQKDGRRISGMPDNPRTTTCVDDCRFYNPGPEYVEDITEPHTREANLVHMIETE